ncbi:MAG TPA: hypothetical protein VGQ91_03310 [Ideonella sp.]|jgi:hypothetical protein|nr:hypothetical protein [Ideonella sp.]
MNRHAPATKEVNELMAAMPIVILFNAVRAAFQRAAGAPRAVFRHSQAN